MCLIGWFQLYKRTGLFLYIFCILLFPCFDECDVASESENIIDHELGDFYFWIFKFVECI